MTEIEDDFWNIITLNMNQVGEMAAEFPSIPKNYKDRLSRP